MAAPPRNGPHKGPTDLLPWGPLAAAGRVPVVLVRHGQTAWNIEGRFLGRSDVPLDEAGRDQAAHLARWLAPLPVQGLVSSPLARAAGTAEAISGAMGGLGIAHEGDLAELDQGELEGHYGRELPQRWPAFFERWVHDPETARVPGGETLGECRDRGVAAIRRLAASAEPGPPLVIVSHKMVISTLICTLLDLPLRSFRLVGQGNTAVNFLSWGEDGLRLHLLNSLEHLPGG